MAVQDDIDILTDVVVMLLTSLWRLNEGEITQFELKEQYIATIQMMMPLFERRREYYEILEQKGFMN